MLGRALLASGRGMPGRPRGLHSSSGARLGTVAMAAGASSASSAAGWGAWARGVAVAGITCGTLSGAGDVVAQMFTKKPKQKLDYARLARMAAFGGLFYGPYQQVWYAALERQWPGRALGNFAAKLLMNQLCLAPVVISAVFAWNLALQNKLREWPQKMRADVWPTLVNGWKFWIPAASINFYAVPLDAQVLYMSICGMAWTGYLSYSAEKAATRKLKR